MMAHNVRRTLYFLIGANVVLALGLVFAISGYVKLHHDLIANVENQQQRCEVANETIRAKLGIPSVDCRSAYPLP